MELVDFCSRDLTYYSKRLAYLLRHTTLPNQSGWVMAKVLYEQYGFNEKILKIIVAFDPKGRFIFSDEKTAVRALYGHSFKIETDELPTLPPTVLYHGTAEKNLASILEKGILPMSRAKVHLSSSIKTAEHVGIRHGRPIVLEINSAAMAADGDVFYKITNDVWQTDYIPAKYITNTIIPK